MKKWVHILFLFLLSVCQKDLYAVSKPVILYKACLDGNSSTVTLLWHKGADACNSFSKYKVYGRESSFTPFRLLKEINTYASVTSTINVTSLKRWEFYIVTLFACDGKDSFTSNKILVDNINPVKPKLDSISVVVGSNTIVAGWSKSASKDVKGYYLYEVVASNVLVKNTINTSANITTLSPSTGGVTISLAAYDSCENTSAISENHKTIFLSQINDKCSRIVTLQWTHYQGWPGIVQYEVYAKIGLGNYQLVGTVDGKISNFKYYHNSYNENICLYVRAYKKDRSMSSTSNTVCFKSDKTHFATQKYLARVTCQNNKFVKIIGRFDTADIKEIILKKKKSGVGGWSTVKSFSPSPSIIHTDITSRCTETSHYQFTLINNCDSVSAKSAIANNIVLTKINKNELGWTYYSPVWLENIEKYELYEKDLSLNSSTWNKIFLGSNTDNYYKPLNTDNKCYKIVATEETNTKGNKKDSSTSNELCFVGVNHVYYPTAFSPNGVNNVYFPKGVSIDYKKSQFEIYNRWGEKIYKTYDIKKGWDGKYNGSYCQEGVYVLVANTYFLDNSNRTCKQTFYIVK